ncbi:MAG: sugar phosphate isomerase/epimerase [Eubacteriales bacterium]|nr:sugar phosphate isomerase/epimerase [Eubacteriales bacterium]
MEIGVFSRTYHCTEVEKTFQRMQEDGIFHTQYNFQNAGLTPLPEKIPEKLLLQIRHSARESGIALDVLTGTFNMIDPENDRRKKSIEQFRLQCYAAAQLEIPVVSLCTGSRHPKDKWTWDDQNLTDAAWSDLLRTTEAILRIAEKEGVVLAFETEPSNIINTPERARKYLDEFQCPQLKVIMDAANLFRPGEMRDIHEEIDKAFALLSEEIVTAHAKDYRYDGKLSFCGAGRGEIDWPYYMKKLINAGYRGSLIMHGLEEEEIAARAEYLRECL